MNGRTPTKAEKRFHDLLARVVGCAACRFGHGQFTDYVSIHHIDGRTKPGCQQLVLPLCGPHHQDTAWPENDFIAIHPWRRRFEARYGTEMELLDKCKLYLGEQGYGEAAESDRGFGERPGPVNGFWANADWLLCRDGKWRPVEPGTFPLADGVPARVVRLRGYGNAINAEAARVFAEVVMEAAS